MEGTGNDFVVIDNRAYNFSLEEVINFTPRLCDRKYGVGADGLLLLEKPVLPQVDYTMIYRNADGSDAGMCGNGSRCLALFASENGFKNSHSFNVHENIYISEVKQDVISIQFPVEVSPSKLTLENEELIKADAATEHVIKFVEEALLNDEKTLVETGKKIRSHQQLNPPGTNVNFVKQLKDNTIKVQTYERGVEDLTFACGTGALASAIASHNVRNNQELHAEYEVQMKGGTLKASFDFDPQNKIYLNLKLSGPANFVFQGIIAL